MNSANILVWGGTGFIGSHLVARLRERYAVSVLTRDSARVGEVQASGACAIVGPPSRYSAAELARVISGFPLICDLSGSTAAVASNHQPFESLSSQCREHLHFLEACALAQSRPHVVFASTRLVYGTPEYLPVTETHPIHAASLYAAHKHCVEQYYRIWAARNALTWSVCRISNPYGFDGRASSKSHGFINALIERGVRGETLTVFGDGRQLRDYIHVEDLTDAIERCLFEPAARNQVFNVGSGCGISIREAAEAVRDATGAAVRLAPWPQSWSEVETGDYIGDIGKLRSLLGFIPRYSFVEGLKQVVDQYAERAGVLTSVVGSPPSPKVHDSFEFIRREEEVKACS